jgi:hypothetical protein
MPGPWLEQNADRLAHASQLAALGYGLTHFGNSAAGDEAMTRLVAGLQQLMRRAPYRPTGHIVLSASASQAGRAWTNDGTARQERGLKHRADNETRIIPIQPVLVRLLRTYIKGFGTTPDGRIFQTARGGILQDSGYNEVWDQARKAALTPPSTGPRSADAPTTCGTRRCRCG